MESDNLDNRDNQSSKKLSKSFFPYFKPPMYLSHFPLFILMHFYAPLYSTYYSKKWLCLE